MMNQETKLDQPSLPALKALADPTRLRLLRLLDQEELTVRELTDLLGMTQSRVSGHLAVLREAGFVRDRRQGTSAWYSINPSGAARPAWEALKPVLPLTPQERRDQAELKALLADRRERDREFFDRAAGSWDAARSENLGMYAGSACLGGLLDGRITVLELGTGTGSLLPLLARHVDRVIAIDSSRGMLLKAQTRMNRTEGEAVQLARGDLNRLPIHKHSVQGAVMNMVLHHVADPLNAFLEAFRVLVPGGRMVVVDFEAHEERRLMEEENHRWPGFEPAQLSAWGLDAGFTIPTILPVPTPRAGRWSRLRVFAARFVKRPEGEHPSLKPKP